MKKTVVFFGVLLLITSVGYPGKLAVRAGAGFGCFFGGDIADGLKGLSDYLADTYAATGEFGAPGFGPNLSAEVVYQISPKMGVGLGFGYFSGGKESEVAFTIDTLSVTQILHPRFQVIPITASFHYHLPCASSKFELDVSAGLGFYLARLNHDESIALSVAGQTGTLAYTYASGGRNGFGPHLGLSVERPLNERLALYVSLNARLVSVALAQGDWTETGSGLFGAYSNQGSDHQPWAYDWTTGGKTYSQVIFAATAPSGADAANVHEAKLGLSAVTLGLGVRFNL